jgi:hypothetical protein
MIQTSGWSMSYRRAKPVVGFEFAVVRVFVVLAPVVLLACRGAPNAASPTDGPSNTDDHTVADVAAHQDVTAETGTSVDAAPPRRICDGSAGIRLAYRDSINSGMEPPFTAVLYDLGADFLYVDGHCHYWVGSPLRLTATQDNPYYAWRPYREGVLTDDQERRLHDAVSYDDFRVSGPACPSSAPADASVIQLWDGLTVHSCRGGPTGVAGDWPMRVELYGSGLPMTGAMRVEVGQEPVPPGEKLYPWPLASGPATYAIAYSRSMSVGQSTLISEPSDVAALRTLREQMLTDQAATDYFPGIILVEPEGYVLALRDDLPFTRMADGLWAPP